MKISIFSKYSNNQNIVETIKQEAMRFDFEIDDYNPDIIIYVGGDGTFLNAIQNNIDRLDDVTFLGVNNGSLGFFYDFCVDEIDEMFEMLDAGLLKTRRINLMQGVLDSGVEQLEFYVFNEVRLASMTNILKCDIYIDEQHLETFVGNEVVISTSCGSTGLNRSIGGAIIDPRLDVYQITPIAPLNSKVYSTLNSPLIVPASSKIHIKNYVKEARLSFDYISLDDDVYNLDIYKSNLFVNVLVKPEKSFIENVKGCFIK